MSAFKMAPELEKRAQTLIRKHHRRLKGIPILYVWRATATKSLGSLVIGSTGRLTGRSAMLLAAAIAGQGELYDAELDDDDDHHAYVIELASDVWLLLDENQRDAALDHFLERCVVDDEGRLKIRVPSSEFPSILERHGAWRDELEKISRALEAHGQMSLELEDPSS